MPIRSPVSLSFLSCALSVVATNIVAQAGASSDPEIDEIRVVGRQINLVGQASTASEGIVSQDELAIRLLLRTGDTGNGFRFGRQLAQWAGKGESILLAGIQSGPRD